MINHSISKLEKLTTARSRQLLNLLLAAILILFTSAASAQFKVEYDDNPAFYPKAGNWAWPSESAQVVRPFIVPAKITDLQHRGIDIAYPEDAVLRSPDSGTVSFVGWVVNRQVLTIDHGHGIVSTFDPIVTNLKTGERVIRNQNIGNVPKLADNPHCSVSCFHLGARYNDKYINPMFLLGELPKSVLYPLPSPKLVP